MSSLFTILTVLIILASVLLIFAVLLQSGKGEGLASNFVAGNQAFGVRQTADLLEKVSWGLVTFILVVSIISSFVGRPAKGTQIKNNAPAPEMNIPTNQPVSPVEEGVVEGDVVPAGEAPTTEAE